MAEKDRALIDALVELLPRYWWRRGPGRNPDARSTCGALHKLYRSDGGLSPGELREMLAVSGPRVTAILNELEGKGLIRRGPSAGDRRGVVITLTDAGARDVEAQLVKRRARAARIVETLGAADAETLVRLLRAVRALDAPEGEDGRGTGRWS